jgi:phosphatidylinositol-3-phosphatase
MPSPWAAAVALLALLAFGVLVGSTLNPAQQSVARTPVLLAASPHGAAARSPAVSPEASPKPLSTPPETSSEATPEATPETTTTVAAAESSSGSKAKSSQPSPGGGQPSSPATELPPVEHVFLIVLSDEGESAAFGASSGAPYLSKTLRGQGELIESYYAVSTGELANAIALMSGQGPNPQTVGDCPLYTDLAPGSAGKLGQAMGSGCVYPSTTLTLADQLTSAGKTWRAYVEDVGNGGGGQPQTCRHPALGAADTDQAPGAGDAYVTWRNPFVYFHSLIGDNACANNDVGLDRLAPDLKAASRTPSFAYVVPNRCHDGSPQACAPGQPAGLPAADAFLRKVVPEIESSAAYKQGGLIAITFDQAPQSGAQADSSGCCLSSPYPNLPAAVPSTPATTTPAKATSMASGAALSSTAPTSAPTGGGRVGLLLISKYVKPASFNATGDYNHFSLLRSIESLFGLQALGYAGEPGLLAFDKSVFNAYR